MLLAHELTSLPYVLCRNPHPQWIYQYIEDNYLFYRKPGPAAQSWRSSIRHNLVFNRAFVKREIEDDGKKAVVWLLAPNTHVTPDGVIITRRSMARQRANSAPSSPPTQMALLRAYMSGEQLDKIQGSTSEPANFYDSGDETGSFTSVTNFSYPQMPGLPQQGRFLPPVTEGAAMFNAPRPSSSISAVSGTDAFAFQTALGSPELMAQDMGSFQSGPFNAPRQQQQQQQQQLGRQSLTAVPESSLNSKIALLAELHADPSLAQFLLKP